LITGGLGYVGGRTARFLAGMPGVTVSVTTRYPDQAVPPGLNAKILPLGLPTDEDLVPRLSGVDVIVHTAAVNEIDSEKRPEHAAAVNILGTLQLLEAAVKAGVRRFIYMSTMHVYGAPLEGKICEKRLPRPCHPYSITHRAAEDFVLAAHDRRLLTGIVLRLSNAFGAPLHPQVNRWSLLVNDLCRQAIRTGSLHLKTPGQQRDFVPLADVEHCLWHLVNLPQIRCGDGLFNLGGESAVRVLDMARLIADRCVQVLGFEPGIIHPEDPSGGGTAIPLVYSIEKLKTTGFALSGKVSEEIDQMLLFCRKHFGGTQVDAP